MPAIADAETLLETITDLALEMGRLCPDCAEKAERIVALARDLRGASLDRGAIQDAIGSEALNDMSDLQVRNAAEAVIRTARDED